MYVWLWSAGNFCGVCDDRGRAMRYALAHLPAGETALVESARLTLGVHGPGTSAPGTGSPRAWSVIAPGGPRASGRKHHDRRSSLAGCGRQEAPKDTIRKVVTESDQMDMNELWRT